MSAFIIDCPYCKAKVGAEQKGCVERSHEDGEPFGERVVIGTCPSCGLILVGRAEQTHFEGYQGDEYDAFSDFVRVYPQPPKIFTSYRIPRPLSLSLVEADLCIQAGANIAACMMLGRALEALCRDLLQPKSQNSDTVAPAKTKRPIMLGMGIKELRERKIIDDRLYDWSVSLQAVRNLAAHPEDFSASRQDVEDLQAFVHAITEYVYDLTDRYEEFKEREEEKRKRLRPAAEMFADVLPPRSIAERQNP
jgi:hypothetical protein